MLFHLQKFDLVTCYYRHVSWLPFSDLIKYHSMCVMFHQFCGCGKGILLKPAPIQFSRLVTDYYYLTLQHAHIKLRIMTYACTIKLCMLEGMLASSASTLKVCNVH